MFTQHSLGSLRIYMTPTQAVPPTTTTATHPAPTTRHAKLGLPEPATGKRFQYFIDIPAQVPLNPHTIRFQLPQQGFRHRSAEKHVHSQLGDFACQLASRKLAQQKLGSPDLFPAAAGNDQQTHRGIEHRRDAAVRDWQGNRHASLLGKTHANRQTADLMSRTEPRILMMYDLGAQCLSEQTCT